MTKKSLFRRARLAPIVSALALMTLLSGCVVYPAHPYHYHYWR